LDIAVHGFTYDPVCLKPADDFFTIGVSFKNISVMYNTSYDTATPIVSLSLVSVATIPDNGVLGTAHFKIISAPPSGAAIRPPRRRSRNSTVRAG
jgi:hypothetical protein